MKDRVWEGIGSAHGTKLDQTAQTWCKQGTVAATANSKQGTTRNEGTREYGEPGASKELHVSTQAGPTWGTRRRQPPPPSSSPSMGRTCLGATPPPCTCPAPGAAPHGTHWCCPGRCRTTCPWTRTAPRTPGTKAEAGGGGGLENKTKPAPTRALLMSVTSTRPRSRQHTHDDAPRAWYHVRKDQ